MREILFRGKRKDDDKWAYGYLYIRNDGQYEISFYSKYFDSERFTYDVIPETVGQYIGLTDKNGKKIFEGDIVKTQPFSDKPYSSKAKYKQHIGVVEYRIRHFKNRFYEQDYEAGWTVTISDYGKFTCYNWNEFFKCEVIGNIHDNPELLEV